MQYVIYTDYSSYTHYIINFMNEWEHRPLAINIALKNNEPRTNLGEES